MTIPQYSEALAKAMFSAGILQFSPCRWASGLESPFKFDLSKLESSPEAMRLAGILLKNQILMLPSCNLLLGVPTGGHAFALAANSSLGDELDVIETQKGDQPIPGISGRKVVIIEDVVTRGGSVIQFIRRVEASGAKVGKVLTIVDHEFGGMKTIRLTGIPALAMLTGNQILDIWQASDLLDIHVAQTIQNFYTEHRVI